MDELTERRRAFTSAAHWFVATTVLADDRWNHPALGEWTVLDLVGHTSRALLTVESYLSDEPLPLDVESAVDYYRLATTGHTDPAAVAHRGREAGAALGDAPAEAVAEIAERVLARWGMVSESAHVATPVGNMRLVDYLPSRTFELTVHTCDLAAALGADIDVPEAAAAEAATLAGGLAARAGSAGTLLLGVTGRSTLPDDFTVL